MSNTSQSSPRVSTPTYSSIKNNPKPIYPNQNRDILKAQHRESLSPPDSENMTKLKPFLPQLFNLSIDQINKINQDKSISDIIAKLLNIEPVHIRKFFKYIASIPGGNKKTIDELSSIIKTIPRNTTVKLSDFPDEILGTIYQQYTQIIPTKYKLRVWINKNKLQYQGLCANPNDKAIELFEQLIKSVPINSSEFLDLQKNLSSNPTDKAIEFLEKNPKYIDYYYLSTNTNDKAIKLLMKRGGESKIDWQNLSINTNDNAIKLLKKNQKFIWYELLAKNTNDNAVELFKKIVESDKQKKKGYFKYMLMNPNDKAIEYIMKNKDEFSNGNIDFIYLPYNTNDEAIEYLENKIDDIPDDKIEYVWEKLSGNTNNKAIKLLKKKREKINWENLSGNTSDKAVELLKSDKSKINWENLSGNTSDEAVELLQRNVSKINWKKFSSNTNIKALELFKKNQDEIDWCEFSKNPIIFEEEKYSP